MNAIALLPQFLLAAGGLLAYCAGAFLPNRRHLPFALALAATVGSLLAVLAAGPAPGDLGSLVEISLFSRFYTGLLSLITALALLLLHRYAQRRGFANEVLYGTMVFATLGLVVVATAVNWLVFFLGFELLSLALYVLIASRRAKEISYEAGLKYFVMGAVASAFLAFGLGLLYGAGGTLGIGATMDLLRAGADNQSLAWAGLGLLLVGIGFKLSLVPFHLWTPDVYEGAPAPITAFLATATKIAVFAFLLHLFRGRPVTGPLLPILWVIAALSMIVGNFTALVQTRVKRLLAYSSVAHMGYLLLALLAGGADGLLAVAFYSAVYGLMDLAAFGGLGLMSGIDEDLNQRQDFRGLGRRQPFAAGLLTLGLLALAGLPPTGGLIGKLLIFTAALRSGFVWLALIGIVTAIVSVYFYLQVVVTMYLEGDESEGKGGFAVGLAGGLAGTVIIVGLLWLGVLPQGLMTLIGRALAAMS